MIKMGAGPDKAAESDQIILELRLICFCGSPYNLRPDLVLLYQSSSVRGVKLYAPQLQKRFLHRIYIFISFTIFLHVFCKYINFFHLQSGLSEEGISLFMEKLFQTFRHRCDPKPVKHGILIFPFTILIVNTLCTCSPLCFEHIYISPENLYLYISQVMYSKYFLPYSILP